MHHSKLDQLHFVQTAKSKLSSKNINKLIVRGALW